MTEIAIRTFLMCACSLLLTAGEIMAQAATTAQAPAYEISLELALSTVRIEVYSGDSLSATATGFFCANDDGSKLFLVTNRHVVRNERETFQPDTLSLRIHTKASDIRTTEVYRIALYRDDKKRVPAWRELGVGVDVVTIELPLADIKQKFVFKAFSPKDFITEDVVLGMGDPVVIIGYPRGFEDQLNGLPVARQGSVASVFPIPFQGNPFFLVDAVLHPGTSGSPVITRPSSMTLTTKGTEFGGAMFRLVGINSGSFGDLQLNSVWFTGVIAQLIR